MRQFQEHEAATVAQRENLVAANFSHQIGLNTHVGPGKHAQGHAPLIEKLLKAGGRRANHRRGVLGKIAQLMGGGDDRANAVGDGHFGHGQRFLGDGRAIVQPWQ